MLDNVQRESGGSQSGSLTGEVDEIALTESIGMDGSYGGGDLSMLLTNIAGMSLIRQNAQISASVSIEGAAGSGVIPLSGYSVDFNEISRPSHGLYNMTLTASSLMKRLELSLILEAKTYDHFNLTHLELVSELCSLAGVTLVADSDPSAITLPVSTDDKAPNWQFSRGTSIWAALQTVREYSGWMMYPKNNTLQYRRFPSGSSGGTIFTMNNDAFTTPKYSYRDNYRTRFYVYGEDENGEMIIYLTTSASTESLIGEARPVVIIDPRLATMEACQIAGEGMKRYYTTAHFYVTFTIERFENYSDLWIGDVIRVVDPEVDEIDGSFMVTRLSIAIDQHLARATVEARSLWT